MNRRDFLFTAPAAATVLPLGLVPLAVRAEGHGAQVTAAQRFAVGETVVTAISDGYLQMSPELLAGLDGDAWAALMTRAYRDPANFLAAVNAYLVQSGDRTIMIDAGTGALMGPTLGQVGGVLGALGVDPARVETLLVTHLHPDHIGGAMADGAPVFPNAEMVVGQVEHDFWTSADIRAQAPEGVRPFFDMAVASVDAYGDRVRLFDGEAEVAPGITARALPGHTPGHTGFVVADGSDSLLIWADIVHVPPVQFARPEVTIAFDTDQAQAAATRADLFASVAESRQMIAGMHMPFPGVGYVEATGDAYAFVPAPWQYL